MMKYWILEKKQITPDNIYIRVNGPNTDGEILVVDKNYLTKMQIQCSKLKNMLDMLPATNNVIFNDKLREVKYEIDLLLGIR